MIIKPILKIEKNHIVNSTTGNYADQIKGEDIMKEPKKYAKLYRHLIKNFKAVAYSMNISVESAKSGKKLKVSRSTGRNQMKFNLVTKK